MDAVYEGAGRGSLLQTREDVRLARGDASHPVAGRSCGINNRLKNNRAHKAASTDLKWCQIGMCIDTEATVGEMRVHGRCTCAKPRPKSMTGQIPCGPMANSCDQRHTNQRHTNNVSGTVCVRDCGRCKSRTIRRRCGRRSSAGTAHTGSSPTDQASCRSHACGLVRDRHGSACAGCARTQ